MSLLKKNIVYNVMYQGLILLVPLITAPYLARILGKEGIGLYSYTYSISSYFVLIAMLGLNNYGNRKIAQYRDNQKIMSKCFFEIYAMQLFFSFICVFVFYFTICFYIRNYNKIFIIQTIYVASVIFDVSWFFYGIEQFKKVLVRNTIFRVVMLIGIFLLVKSAEDLWKYVLLMSLGTFVSQFYLWLELRKYLSFNLPRIKDIVKHLKPNLLLFIPVIAVSLYRNMDKIMVGKLSSLGQTGLYTNADSIISLPLSLIVAIGTVMMPRMANLYYKNETDKVERYIRDSIQLIVGLAIAMSFGIAAISIRLAPIYFGVNFTETGILIFYLSPTIIFITMGNIIRVQYLIPREKDKIYVTSVIFGAFINIFLNYHLIPIYAAKGAIIATLITEFLVMFTQCIASIKELNFKLYFKDIIPFFIAGGAMYGVLKFSENIITDNISGIILEILIGIFVYIFSIFVIMKIVDKKRLDYLLEVVFK